MNDFEQIKNEDINIAIEKINSAIKKALLINPKLNHSKTFKKDSGLGVTFSEVERFCNQFGFDFVDNQFVKKVDSKVEEVDYTFYKINKNQYGHPLKKASVQLYDNVLDELNSLYEQFPHLNKSDILNAIIITGLNSFK